MLQNKIKKIHPSNIAVYVGLDFVGDGLIKLPFIRSLKQVFPKARITWIAGTHKSEFNDTLLAVRVVNCEGGEVWRS